MAVDSVKSNAQSCMDLLVKGKKREEEEDSQTGMFTEMMAGFLNGVKDEAAIAAAAASEAVSSAEGTRTDSSRSTPVAVSPGEAGAVAAKVYDPSEAVIQKLLEGADFAAKSIDELAAGLEEDFDSYGERFMEPYVEAGAHYAQRQSVWTAQMVSPGIPLPQPKDGNFTLNDPAWAEYHAEINRRQQPEYLAMIRERDQSLRTALRERVDSGVADELNAEWEQLMTRASLTKAARNIDGFAEEYAADPTGTVKKYSSELNDYMQDVRVTMRDGVVTCSY